MEIPKDQSKPLLSDVEGQSHSISMVITSQKCDVSGIECDLVYDAKKKKPQKVLPRICTFCDLKLPDISHKEENDHDIRKIFCTFCNQEVTEEWFRCRMNDCEQIKICSNCTKGQELNHKIVESNIKIHRGFSCDGCSVTKNQQDFVPIVGHRFKCLHVECKFPRDYCEECLQSKEHTQGHELYETENHSSEREYNCSFGEASDKSRIKTTCLKKINGQAKLYKCKHPECQNCVYCEDCFKNGSHTSNHVLIDSKQIKHCICCQDDLSKVNNAHTYICVEDDEYKQCQKCRTEINACYQWKHAPVPVIFQKKIVNSKFAQLLESDHHLAQDIFDHVILTKLKPEFQKEAQEAFKKAGHKFLIREILFVISEEDFNKIQEYLSPDKSHFKELLALRIEASVYDPKESKWGGWEFRDCKSLQKYMTKMMHCHLEIHSEHEPIERFGLGVHAPTFLCQMHESAGKYMHHFSGDFILEKRNIRYHFNCKKGICPSCKKEHFLIPLQVHPKSCADAKQENDQYNEGNENEEENKDENFNANGDNGAFKDDHEEKQSQDENGENDGSSNSSKQEINERLERMESLRADEKARAEHFLLDGKIVDFIPEDEVMLELKLSFFSSSPKENHFKVEKHEETKKGYPSIYVYIILLLGPLFVCVLPPYIYFFICLWTLLLSGLLFGVFTFFMDIFVIIGFFCLPAATRALFEMFPGQSSTCRSTIFNIGIALSFIFGHNIMGGILGDSRLAYYYLVGGGLILAFGIIGVCSAFKYRNSLTQMQTQVTTKINEFYEKLDTASAAQVASEITFFCDVRQATNYEVEMLELASSVGLVMNMLVFGIVKVTTNPDITNFIANTSCGITQLFNGQGFDIMMAALLVEGLIILTSKMGLTYLTNKKADELEHNFDHVCECLEYIKKLPEPIIQTDEIFRSSIKDETVMNFHHVTFVPDKMGMKFSVKKKSVTDAVLKALMGQIKQQHSFKYLKYSELKKLIEEAAEHSISRTNIVKGELILLLKECEYKFLGYWKVDKDFMKKVQALVGTVLGTSALLVFKKVTGAMGEGNSEGESESEQ